MAYSAIDYKPVSARTERELEIWSVLYGFRQLEDWKEKLSELNAKFQKIDGRAAK